MIYLLRHGFISGCEEKRFIGQSDLHLSAQGRRQAEFWRRQLAKVPFEEYFCSDLLRSRESAQIIASKSRGSIMELEELREINLGLWDGLPMAEIRARFPRQWEERGKNFEHFRPPEGESFSDLCHRVMPCFKKIIKNLKTNILIVGHAGVNRIILSFTLALPIDKIFFLAQDYGALNIIDHKSCSAPIKAINLPPFFKLD